MFSFRISARRISASITLCLAAMLLMTGCSLPWQHSARAKNVNAPRPTTQQLLTSLQKNFKSVTAFHVVMQVQNPGPVTGDQIQIRNAIGDVLMPDKVSAQATVILSGQATQVKLISIGGTQFITDPITGQWRVIKGILDPRTLTNPDTGIVSLVGKVQHVSEPVDDVVNGVPCWRITGQLDAQYIAFFTGGGVPAGTMLQTSACIGKLDSLPYQLKVSRSARLNALAVDAIASLAGCMRSSGQAARNDTKDTSYTFVMSNYNENITIVAPPV